MKEYFKPRPRFKPKEHPFDIGRQFSWWRSHDDRHYLNALYERTETEFEAFYQWHLVYFLTKNGGSEEQEYFRHILNIVSDEITALISEDKPGSRSRHERINSQKTRLRAFETYLKSIDRWDTNKAKDKIIAERDDLIVKLEVQLEEKNRELKIARKHETADYINITEGHLLTLIDLYLQMQDIKLPEGKELLLSQTQIVWVKMICKFYRVGDKEISSDTIRRYFPGDKRDPGDKYSTVPPKNRLFRIDTAKKRS